jgi:subtilase family serine protease
LLLAFTASVMAEERQALTSQIPPAVKRLNLQPTDRLPAATILSLQIGLQLRNPEGFASQLKQLYNPASPQYHQWLTPDQIAQNYGPTEQDYQAVIASAQANGLQVTSQQLDHTLLGVKGAVSDIEKMFHVKMQVYQHPTEDRAFYAPDVEPSFDLSVPLWHISGLDNFDISRPVTPAGDPTHANLKKPIHDNETLSAGSGPGNSYVGNDFRNLYVQGVNLKGSGQKVGVLSEEDFYTSDIVDYEKFAGLPDVPITKVIIDQLSLLDTNGQPNTGEASLDLEMVISMAPELSEIIVYEGFGSDQVAILKSMQTNNFAKQLTSSYSIHDANDDPIFMLMAMQGQSFFAASGDHGAFYPGTGHYNDDAYVTIVGGTSPTTISPGGAWSNEVVWSGSGGGISYSDLGNYPIPSWQQGVNMSLNGGSTNRRNCPDVSMIASENLFIIQDDGVTNHNIGGTSASTPLWAAFTALVNEQAAAIGQPSVGFLNPLVYAIGEGANYTTYFHDITVGNNTSTNSPNEYYATAGYDLCTGWGTPIGSTLIYQLAQTAGSVWVDFNYSASSPQLGTFANPYSTLAQGVSAVTTGGNIFIDPGSSTETITISKAVTINAFSGPATVGQ